MDRTLGQSLKVEKRPVKVKNETKYIFLLFVFDRFCILTEVENTVHDTHFLFQGLSSKRINTVSMITV